MFSIRQLVSGTCTSQVACVHLHHLLSDLTQLQQPKAKSETCSSKQSQRKREELGVKSLCRNLSSSFDNACKKNLTDTSIVPSSVLDKIQSAIEECLHRHPISKQIHDLKLQPGEIPLDEIRAAIAKHIQFPQKNDKMADYVNCQVKGEVRQNKFQIYLTFNFYTVEHVPCQQLNIDTVVGLALDNSSVNVCVPGKKENGSHCMLTPH